MPLRVWNHKRERQYEYMKSVLESCGRSEHVAEAIAARSINKERARYAEAMQRSRTSINDISSATSSVASAIEEQSATTNEISRNMQTAAHSTELIATNLDSVSSASTGAAAASEEMLSASKELTQQADRLNAQVDAFLGIRLVVRNATAPVTALEVRDRLHSIGVDLDKYSNPLASIHTVLKRMHDAGELVEREREDEPSARTAYAFVLPRVGIAISQGKRRVTGQGLCPPKDRKK